MRKFRSFIPFFLFAIIFSATIAQNVSALDEPFYSGNDILFTDPDACKNGGTGGIDIPANVTGTESEDKNAEIIFKFLISTKFEGFGGKSFNAVQAAGALGNFYQESRFDPGAIEGNGEGHGLAQWSYGRKTELFAFAKENGKAWNDMGLQLKLIAKEINASYGKSLLNAHFDTVSSPKEASYIFQKIFESAGTPAQATRDGAAQKYYTKFKDLAPEATTDTSGAVSCESPNGDATDATDGSFVVYNQYDPKWSNKAYGSSTIGDSGCGPSAMAMIITALTGKRVTPEDTAKYAGAQGMYIPGSGSSWDVAPVLAKHWGLKAGNIPNTVTAVNDILKAGGMVVTSGSGAAPFTSGGHYIAIRALTANGKWKIGDSNGKAGTANSQKEWDPRAILDIANADNIVAITK